MLIDYAINRLMTTMCDNLSTELLITPEILNTLKQFKPVTIRGQEIRVTKSAVYVSSDDGDHSKFEKSDDFAYLIFAPGLFMSEVFSDMPTDNEILEFISSMINKRNPIEFTPMRK